MSNTTVDSRKQFIERFTAARRAATPLMCIHTTDQYATLNVLLKGAQWTSPLIQWDAQRGWNGLNEEGKKAIAKILLEVGREAAEGDKNAEPAPISITRNAAEMMPLMQRLPNRTVVFMLNAHRVFFEDTSDFSIMLSAALCNLRDQFKNSNRALVMLCPSHTFAMELRNDVYVIEHALPTAEEVRNIVKSISINNKEGNRIELQEDNLEAAVDALKGLTAFQGEQAATMAFRKEGLDIDQLWDIKRRMISETPGLSVWKETVSFDDIGGGDQFKAYLKLVLNSGTFLPVFIDEIEKGMAGSEGDNTGVSQDIHGTMLKEMANTSSDGVLCVGHPGCGKSIFAKALASEARMPLVELDLGAVKQGVVGSTEKNIRRIFEVIRTVSGGEIFYIATCNGYQTLSPELRRRFKAIFMFDLPEPAEQAKIWEIKIKANKLEPKQYKVIPPHPNWTGAEIEQCCVMARKFKVTLLDASKYIIPLAISAREKVKTLRREAHERFLSAAYPGTYLMPTNVGEVLDTEVRGRKAEYSNAGGL